jgi:hypothetical protein
MGPKHSLRGNTEVSVLGCPLKDGTTQHDHNLTSLATVDKKSEVDRVAFKPQIIAVTTRFASADSAICAAHTDRNVSGPRMASTARGRDSAKALPTPQMTSRLNDESTGGAPEARVRGGPNS